MSTKQNHRYWDADGVSSTAPTSIDVLLEWLHVPGNYKRWQSQKKSLLCYEIVGCMEQAGITHRTDKTVALKMSKLEHGFESATNWLLTNGHYDNYWRGETTKEVRVKVGKLCPYYDELLPILQGGTSTSEARRKSSSVTRFAAPTSPQRRGRPLSSRDGPARRSRPSCVPAAQPTDSVKDEAIAEHKQRLLELELESRKADAICNKALNRKKMLDAGIDRDEVDRLLPQ